MSRRTPAPVAKRVSQSSKPSLAPARSAGSARSASSASAKSTYSARPSKTSVKEEPKPKKQWDLPALSVTYKPKVTESELEKLKKKTIRRNAPPGEDLKQIKNILRSVKGQPVSVQEFISLIGPSTGDQGECLRVVMNDELHAFRKLARKVYDTITKDNSDVLLNQQLQLTEFYKEKKQLLHDKMMKHIEEIYKMEPKFDFDTYAAGKNKYLELLFPIPEELQLESEDIELMKRQAAYHRLQWLRSEGERLNEENNSLKNRLKQLKRMHRDEQERMLDMEREAEAKKESLEAEQAEKVEELEVLNESLEKTIIDKEKNIRIEADQFLIAPSQGAIKKAPSKTKTKKKRRPPPWNQDAAKDIEKRTLERSEASETTRARSPFHFSPIKTPPQQTRAPRELSPFHYSPPKPTEGARYVSPAAPRAAPAAAQPAYGRRGSAAPRDTWGGFY